MVLDEPAAVVDGEPDERTGLRRLYVAPDPSGVGPDPCRTRPRCRSSWVRRGPRCAAGGIPSSPAVHRPAPPRHRAAPTTGPSQPPGRAAPPMWKRVDAAPPAAAGTWSRREAAADQDLLARTRLAAPARLGAQRGEHRRHAGRGARREVGVEAGQVRELLAQGVPVGGPVDRPVEGPPAAVQLADEPLDGGEVDLRRPRRGTRARTPRPPPPAVLTRPAHQPRRRPRRRTRPPAAASPAAGCRRRRGSPATVPADGVSPSAAMSVTSSRRSAPPAWAATASSTSRAITSRTARLLMGPHSSSSLQA
ncbi:hypothetical protein SALBM217S_01401 [Streptomyces griseoloalbus]